MAKTETSKHLDSNKKATKAGGERKHGSGTLMEGIVGGIAKKVSPPVIDGIVRGCERGSGSNKTNAVAPGATKQSKGAFGSGAFPEGQR